MSSKTGERNIKAAHHFRKWHQCKNWVTPMSYPTTACRCCMRPTSPPSESSKSSFSAQTFRTFCPKISLSTSRRCAIMSAPCSKPWPSCTRCRYLIKLSFFVTDQGTLTTIDLLILTGLDQLLFLLIFFTFLASIMRRSTEPSIPL